MLVAKCTRVRIINFILENSTSLYPHLKSIVINLDIKPLILF